MKAQFQKAMQAVEGLVSLLTPDDELMLALDGARPLEGRLEAHRDGHAVCSKRYDCGPEYDNRQIILLFHMNEVEMEEGHFFITPPDTEDHPEDCAISAMIAANRAALES